LMRKKVMALLKEKMSTIILKSINLPPTYFILI